MSGLHVVSIVQGDPMVGCSISIIRKEVKVSEVRKVMLVLVALSVAGLSLAAEGEKEAINVSLY